MKNIKVVIGVISILIGIFALIESYDVFRLASTFGVKGFHIYVGFIVGFILISFGILSLMMMNEQSKKYAEIAIPLNLVAISLCFKGPEIFSDLLFFAGWGLICLIFVVVAYYKSKHEEEEDELISQVTYQTTCPYCHAAVDDNSLFCGSCGKEITKSCPHCGALVRIDKIFCTNCKRKIDEAPSMVPFESPQKNCPQCGATINKSASFCSECGYKIPQGNTCAHCGTPVNNEDIFCKNCGHKVNEVSSTSIADNFQQVCPHCGVPVNDGDVFCQNCGNKIDEIPSDTTHQTQAIEQSGNLTIRWDGAWLLINTKIGIAVNGNYLGKYSFKEGFETSVPIPTSETIIVTKFGFYTTTEKLNLDPTENYTYELSYHRMSGWFGFILYNNQGDELRKDKLHWGICLLCYLLPIIGIIYAIIKWKKKPASSYTAIYSAILGILISLLISNNLSSLSKFSGISNQTAPADTDSIEVVESTDAYGDISDVYSEAYIKYRLQKICDEIPSLNEDALVRRYFSESFKELYNAVIREDEKEAQEGNVGFFNFVFWTGGQDGDLQSVTVLEVRKTTETYASATVQDLITFGENDESKSSKQLNLVFENGDWYIDDFNSYRFRMEEYLKEDEGDDGILSQEELAKTNAAIGTFNVAGNDETERDNYNQRNQDPEFIGGESAINNFIAKNLKYPVVAEENGIQGKVVVGFAVERDGSITDVKIVRGVDPSLDREAMRVIKLMPKWNPGMRDGEYVRIETTLPVTFRLQ